MAKEENLSMDEILSSIRNILIEEGVDHKNEQEDVDDDILDLSTSQIIEDKPSSEPLPEVEAEPEILPEPSVEVKPVAEANEYFEEIMTMPEVQKEVQEEIIEEIDTEAEPIYSDEDNSSEHDFTADPIYQEDDTFLNNDDVSEGLLNNFAQIFAKKEDESKPSPIEPVVIKASASPSLDDLIVLEVSKQVKVWLDANLQTIAEDLVKKELSRVMERAGK